MYKVSLKIHRIGLRLKQNIQIQTAIKKHDQSLTIPKTTYLQNGIAELDASAQFYLQPSHPIFCVYVSLIHENSRKLVGMLTIDVNKFQINSNNQVHSRLEQSPDMQSYITLQFGYTVWGLSLNEDNMQEIVKQMQERNNDLEAKNIRLEEQLKELKQTNMDLENGKNTMGDSYEQNQHQISIEEGRKKLKVQDEESYINEMEEKMFKLKKLMDNFGGQDIRDQVHHIFKYQ